MDQNIVFTSDPADYWAQMRIIIREEIARAEQLRVSFDAPPGLTNKPVYKINEICQLFQISKPTVYEWIRTGKLQPVKIRSRVFFRGSDIEKLLS